MTPPGTELASLMYDGVQDLIQDAVHLIVNFAPWWGALVVITVMVKFLSLFTPDPHTRGPYTLQVPPLSVTIATCPYSDILTAGLALSQKKLRKLRSEDLEQLRTAVRWTIERVREEDEREQLRALKKRIKIAAEDRKVKVVDGATAGRLPWPGTAGRSEKASPGVLVVTDVVRKAFVVPNEFRTAELDPSELTKLDDLARELVASPKKKLSKLTDDEVLEAGVALECALRVGGKNSNLRLQHRRFVQEWDRRDRRTPDESTLAERGVGELGEVLAVREQKHQEELAADWEAEFESLAAEVEQRVRPSYKATKRNRKAIGRSAARDEVAS